MDKLFYIANARLPTEKAHGLQIVEMCEAFSKAGYDVSLIVPRRQNAPELQHKNLSEHYGIEPLFPVIRLWCLDLMSSASNHLMNLAFWLLSWTFYIVALFWLLHQSKDAIIYSRDLDLLWLASWLTSGRFTVYEAHNLYASRWYRAKLTRVLQTTDVVVSVTRNLAEQLKAIEQREIIVEHDGFRATRFATSFSQPQARKRLKIPSDAFVAAYIGRMETMGMSKGMDTVVDAFACCFKENPAWKGHLLLVGGPENRVNELREQWQVLGLPASALTAVGQVSPSMVPEYLATSNVCLMPQPWTEFYAYHTSPLKLFEYMAAGKPILASDLPSFREIISEPDNSIFVPPGDAEAMAHALFELWQDRTLCQKISRNNRRKAMYYEWGARAARLRNAIEKAQLSRVTEQQGAR